MKKSSNINAAAEKTGLNRDGREGAVMKPGLAHKILLMALCALVMLTQTGCRRESTGDARAPRADADRPYYSDSSHERGRDESERAVDGITHTVAAGQSLITLKDIYGISIPAIKKHNPGVSENTPLKVGQKVFIPGSPSVLTARRDSYLKTRKNSGAAAQETAGDEFEKLNWPVAGTVLSKFSPASKGIYIKIAPGAAVKAVSHGEVVYSGKMKGYGNLIIIDHLNGLFSIYGLNAKNLVAKGDAVKAGAKIAIGGEKITDGYSKLYFELRTINAAGEPESVDPLKYLKAAK